MNIARVFSEGCIRIGAAPKDKHATLELVARIAHETGRFPGYSEKQICRSLNEREKAGSTGFEQGVALPHCSLEGAEGFVAGLLTVPEGVAFDSFDGEPATLIFFVIGPQDRRNDHIQLISGISRHALDEGFRSRLLACDNPTDALSVVSTALTEEEEPEGSENRSMFHIFIQRPEPFEELLRVFSAAVPGSLCVLDGANAGSFVERMPLFSSFWTDREDRFFKIIIAVVNERLQNELIRRINTIVPDIGDHPGVMYVVQPITFAAGSIEY